MSKMSSDVSEDIFIETRRLCLISINTAIKKLCEAGSWPRPPRARVMRIGSDLTGNDIKGIKEVHDLVEILASQDYIKNTYLRHEGDKCILEDYWTRLLLNVLSETDGITVNHYIFNKWFKKFIKEIYTDTSLWRTIDIIDGLILPERKLKLDQNSILMQIPDYHPSGWLEYLVPKHDNCFIYDEFIRRKFSHISPHDRKALLVTTMKIKKSEYKGWQWPTQQWDTARSMALIAAIRLNKPGSLYLQASGFFHLSHLPLGDPLGYTNRDTQIKLYEKNVIVTRNDYRNIRGLWHELINTTYGMTSRSQVDTDVMNIARSRFFSSYDTEGWFQKILDLTIALEALFSPSDSQEISHRISLRCAWLLNIEQQDAKNDRIYDSIRTMYNLRSRIVHGDAIKEKEIIEWIGTISGATCDRWRQWELRETALESARDIVRRALKACYVLSKFPRSSVRPCWPLPKNFDQNMILPIQQKIWQKAAGILK